MEGRHTNSPFFQGRISQETAATQSYRTCATKSSTRLPKGCDLFSYSGVNFLLYYIHACYLHLSSFRKIRLIKINAVNCKRTKSTSSYICSLVEAWRMLTPAITSVCFALEHCPPVNLTWAMHPEGFVLVMAEVLPVLRVLNM